MKLYNTKYLILLLFIIGLFSCERDACNLQHAKLQITFYKLSYDTTGKAVETIREYKFSKIFALSKETLFPKDTVSSGIGIPLPSDRNLVDIVVEKDTLLRATNIDTIPAIDTISLSFKPSVAFVSHACGFTTHYDSIRVLNSTFDSVAVEKNFIKNTDERNIKIYYR